jgi:hypothetical protein
MPIMPTIVVERMVRYTIMVKLLVIDVLVWQSGANIKYILCL